VGLGFFAWLGVGLFGGIIGKMLMGDRLGWIMTIVLGVVGAYVGGWISSYFGGPSVNGFNLVSIVVAGLGAALVLFVAGLLRGSR
jgi:uncharacterized membrane protein YeaQ/YmgE (transglycosylase-associated protein family)